MADCPGRFLYVIYVVPVMLQDAQQALYWIQEMELHMLYQFMKVLPCLIVSWGLILQDEMCHDISGKGGW